MQTIPNGLLPVADGTVVAANEALPEDVHIAEFDAGGDFSGAALSVDLLPAGDDVGGAGVGDVGDQGKNVLGERFNLFGQIGQDGSVLVEKDF